MYFVCFYSWKGMIRNTGHVYSWCFCTVADRGAWPNEAHDMHGAVANGDSCNDPSEPAPMPQPPHPASYMEVRNMRSPQKSGEVQLMCPLLAALA